MVSESRQPDAAAKVRRDGRGGQYHSGDARDASEASSPGRCHTSPAQQYIKQVKQYLRERIWLKSYFQQP